MPGTVPQFPTIVTRAQKGVPLLDQEMDANWTGIREYCLTLAALIVQSLNPDGTLVAGSVGSNALQAASVTLAALNPTLLYSIIPVDTDAGKINAYSITARGGLGGSNLVPAGATYDGNGNYVITGLTPNYGYFWTPSGSNTNDISCIVNDQTTITGPGGGAFTAITTGVVLTGTPGDAVTATLIQSAPINAYKNGQVFWVYTTNGNTGPSTLDVNNIGAAAITLDGQPLQDGDIPANSVFIVAVINGAFALVSSGGSSNNGTAGNSVNYTIQGTSLFSSGQLPIPNSTLNVAHGFGNLPTGVAVFLKKLVADATTPAVGQLVPIGQFQVGTAPAFDVSFDANVITITPISGTVTLGGTNITPGNWNLVVTAVMQTNLTNTVFPALSYWSEYVAGAVSYGNNLLVWNFGFYTNIVNGYVINLTSNLVTPLTAPAVGNPGTQNHNVFTRANGSIQDIFVGNDGIYTISATNPITNLVPQASVYGTNGLFVVTIPASTALTVTPGQNDLAYGLVVTGTYPSGTGYSAFTGPPVNISNSNTSTTLTLAGNPGASVTATVVNTTTGVWQPTQISTSWANASFKPAWITETGGNITNVYVISSCSGAGTGGAAATNALSLIQCPISGTAAEVGAGGTRPDLTNANIGNIAPFNVWYPAGTAATLFMVQYNPFLRRLYVVTSQIGIMHIFKFPNGTDGAGGNDITVWWALANGATKYGYLAYEKSIGIAGIGAAFTDSTRANMNVEINQQTGKEVAIVFTQAGNTNVGSITRVPWVE